MSRYRIFTDDKGEIVATVRDQTMPNEERGSAMISIELEEDNNLSVSEVSKEDLASAKQKQKQEMVARQKKEKSKSSKDSSPDQ